MKFAYTTRLLIVAAVIKLATGISLYAFPRDFPPSIYGPMLPYIPLLSAALIAGGLLALLLARYPARPPIRRALAVLAAAPLLLLARYIFLAGGYSGATAYSLLTLAVVAAPWFEEPPDDQPHRRPTDLFGITLGLIHLVIGTLMTLSPQIFRSPAFIPIRPYMPLIGLLALVAVPILLGLTGRLRLPALVRAIAGTLLPLIMMITFARTGAWTGVTLWLFWALGALMESTPWFRSVRHVTASESDGEDRQAEQMIEAWSWGLAVLVVGVTSLMNAQEPGFTIPRSILFVLTIASYNVAVHWLLPPFGTVKLRIHLHLVVLSLAIGLILSTTTPVASALLPVFLAIPMVGARLYGRGSGFPLLAGVLAVVLLSGLIDLLVDRLPLDLVLAPLTVQLVTVAMLGTMAILAGSDQRRLFRELGDAQADLERRHVEVQYANELLQAQSEELTAQQEELMAQHERVVEQSEALLMQRDQLEEALDRAEQATGAMQESETRFRAAFENAPIGMLMVTPALTILQANRAFGEMLGVEAAALAGRSIQSISHPDDYPLTAPRLETVLSDLADGFQFEKRYLHTAGHEVWTAVSTAVVRDPQRRPLYLISQILDITERRRTEAQLHHMANYDPLTDLINRRRFQQVLEEELAAVAAGDRRGALLFLDFDQFKFVNDTLGHRAGDDLLCSLSRRLVEALGSRGTIARLGGDEFGILLADTEPALAEAVAVDLLRVVRSHLEIIGGQPVSLTGSIGVALYPDHGRTAAELMTHADLAMYQAKESGRNRHRIYTSAALEAELGSRLNWERRIREALEQNRFVLHFQPILDLSTQQVDTYEALVRMVDEDGALVMPREFLGVAESYGLIHPIDRWVVREAIRTIAHQRQRRRRIRVAVNLSARAFTDPELLAQIQGDLEHYDVQAESLRFEITETAAVTDIGTATSFIETLSRLGCRFALDDFGAGFSSLYYLRRLPVSYLKIDGSFIERLPQEPVDQKMVRAVATLARELGMETVAEYVQCEKTVALLKEFGVTCAQGYHIGRPGPLP